MERNDRWTILLACCVVSFVWILNNSALPPLLPIIKDEFELTYLQTGLASSASMVAYCGIQFPIGLLADRFGKKRVVLTGTFWVVITLVLIGLSKTYNQFLICLIIIGLGNGMHFIPTATLITDVFGTNNRGRALSINCSAMAASRTITPIFAVPAAIVMGWRGLFYVFSMCGLVAGLIFWRLVRERKKLQKTQVIKVTTNKENMIRGVLGSKLIKISAVAHLMGYAISIIVFLPLFLIQRYGMTTQNAAIHSIIPSLIMAVGAPLYGTMVDRHGRKATILLSGLLLTISSALLVVIENYCALIAILVAIGLSNGMTNPAILAYSAEIAHEETRASGMGFMNTFWVLGGVIGPAFIGVIADIAGLGASFLILTLLPIAAIILVVTLLKD